MTDAELQQVRARYERGKSWLNTYAPELSADVRALVSEVERLTAELERWQRGVIAASDALVQSDSNEAYHQLYALVEPTFSIPGDPFKRLRAALSGGGDTR